MEECTLKPGDVIYVPEVENNIAKWSSGLATVSRIQKTHAECYINLVDHINVTFTWSELKALQEHVRNQIFTRVFVKKWFD